MNEYLKEYPVLLTVNDVSIILNIKPRTVRSLVNTGSLEAVKIGRLIRIPKEKLIEYLNTH